MSRPPIRRVALLTAGGYAPCLSSAVGGLIQRYTELLPDVEIIGYKHPDPLYRTRWSSFYKKACEDLHVTPETHDEMNKRLNDWDRKYWDWS